MKNMTRSNIYLPMAAIILTATLAVPAAAQNLAPFLQAPRSSAARKISLELFQVYLPGARTGPLSLTWQAARAGINPRFLLTSPKKEEPVGGGYSTLFPAAVTPL